MLNITSAVHKQLKFRQSKRIQIERNGDVTFLALLHISIKSSSLKPLCLHVYKLLSKLIILETETTLSLFQFSRWTYTYWYGYSLWYMCILRLNRRRRIVCRSGQIIACLGARAHSVHQFNSTLCDKSSRRWKNGWSCSATGVADAPPTRLADICSVVCIQFRAWHSEWRDRNDKYYMYMNRLLSVFHVHVGGTRLKNIDLSGRASDAIEVSCFTFFTICPVNDSASSTLWQVSVTKYRKEHVRKEWRCVNLMRTKLGDSANVEGRALAWQLLYFTYEDSGSIDTLIRSRTGV